MCGPADPHPPLRHYEVHATSAPLEEDVSPTVYAAKAAYRAAGIGPEDVDIAQLQDTDAGAEIIHMAETGLCADGEQEKLLADGATGSTARCRSTPTAD